MTAGRTGARAAVAVAILAGLACAGAAASPRLAVTPPRGVALAKLLPTPRLFRMTTTSGPLAAPTTVEMCLSGAFLSQRLRDFGARAAGGAGALPPGCTLTSQTRPGGGFHIDAACDRAAGAGRTTHLVLEGTAKDIRQSLEIVLDDPRSGDPHILAVDARFKDIGACPAGMTPGQTLGPDGRFADPTAEPPPPPARAKPE